jgi:propanediol dehydratase small subunit
MAKQMEPYSLINRLRLDDLERVGPDFWQDRIASFARNLSRRNKARLIAELQRKPNLSLAEKEFLIEVGNAFRPYPTSRRM